MGVGPFAKVFPVRPTPRGADLVQLQLFDGEAFPTLVVEVLPKPGDIMRPRERSLKDLEWEVSQLSQWRHPNIKRCFGHWALDGVVHLALEYSRGPELPPSISGGGPCDLWAFVVRHPDPIHEQVSKLLFAQLLNGMSFLHARDIAIRDVRPEQIMVFDYVSSPDIRESLIRVPIVKISCIETEFAGPLIYTAPEIIAAVGKKGAVPSPYSADIYSLGITLFFFLSKKHPFTFSASEVQISSDIAAGNLDWQPVNGQPGPVLQVLHALLELDPARRPTATEALLLPWFSSIVDADPGLLAALQLDGIAATIRSHARAAGAPTGAAGAARNTGASSK